MSFDQTERASALLTSNALRWRCIGPPRGGRVVAVAGDPVDPMTFYFGACAGGIWKTTSGGAYWECVSDGFLGSSSVGALAVAPSDANVIYAGMGETTIRVDVSYGDGVYRSTDAGRTWKHMGLAETRHIGEIRVHPDDPMTLYVAAFGHAFGPNPERGVYRSRDGGETWDLILHESETSGAIDITMDPTNPRILFAAMWEAHRAFWTLSSGGEGCKLYRSTDGGDTWTPVNENPGFAKGLLGKIGVSLTPKAGRVFALVEAKDEQAGLYRSEDYGDSWTQISPNRDLIHRPWYYTHVFADPVDAETVYVTNYQMWKSTDGGRNFHEITTPHGDNHDLWIDPANHRRMVQGNDGGANVSFDAGLTWTTIYNQPTAQFYRMDVDNQYPYHVYATQQDNTSIAVPNATEHGVITMGDCFLPGTGESGFIAVHPEDPNIVYIGAVGSSPGGQGALQRYDRRTRQMQLVNVWPEQNTGHAPKDLKYRFAWTYPILFSPHDSGVLYAGGNHVFRSRDEGHTWEEISPDLTTRDETKLGHSGGPLTGDSAGAETYASLSTLVESTHRKGELWAGTDDGLVHISRDDGGSWQNVTPPDQPEWTYIASVEVSAHDADTVYIAATRYKNDDYQPYLYRSTDSGASWTSLTANFPDGEITRVLRADPVRPGLLFVGTETGVFATLDDGATWQRMQGGFPNVPVYDLKIKHDDLIAATHGRSFWVLDDLTALRGLGSQGVTTDPRPAHRMTLGWATGLFDGEGLNYAPAFGVGGATYMKDLPDGSKRKIHLDVGENPPSGVIVWYWLEGAPTDPITLTIQNASGVTIRTLSSDGPDAVKLPTEPGLNRYVWNMGTEPPTDFDASLVAKKYEPLTKSRAPVSGPQAPPGAYTLTLTINGEAHEIAAEVHKDPRVPTDQSGFDAQYQYARKLTDAKCELRRAVNGLRRLRPLLETVTGAGADVATTMASRLTEIETELVDTIRETPRDVLRSPNRHDDTLGELLLTLSMSDTAPTAATAAVADEVVATIAAEVAAYDKIAGEDLAALNAVLAQAGAPHIAP